MKLDGGAMVMSRDVPHDNTSEQLTTAQSFVLLIVLITSGVSKAWLALSAGVVTGYGLGAAIAQIFGLSFQSLSWIRLASRAPIVVAACFAMMGYLIECLRFQAVLNNHRGLAGYTAARRLRLQLFACLGVAAVAVGLYASLWWIA